MKRVGNLYEKIYAKGNLRRAIRNAQSGKNHYRGVIEVNKDPEKYVNLLHDMLKDKTYQTSEYVIYTKIDKGKEREIYKLPFFPDRIAHWAVIQVVEPYFLNKLNHCTHSAIPKRGIHSAFKQLDGYMRNDVKETKYCLKMDVKKFYPSINHNRLKEMYRTIFKDADLLWLIDEIIESSGDGTGVPIGNYLSQYSGNLYLYKFDRWLKEDLRLNYYIRYMDDIVILHHDKMFLHDLKIKIEDYLNNDLRVTIKGDWQVFPSRIRGIDFVGYRHFGNYVLLRKSIALSLTRKMRSILKNINKGRSLTHNEWSSINSYKGWLKWCDCHNLYTDWIKPLEHYAEEYYLKEIKR